jgi:glycosyltransferase involved in cell wall biosynthesis
VSRDSSVPTSENRTEKKIVQIVTLISDDHAFGGPLSVALDILSLPPQGYEVELHSTYNGELPLTLEKNENVKFFRSRRSFFGKSFGWLFSGELLRNLVRNRREIDLVHIHLARDIVTISSALICALFNIKFVVQSHGMLESRKKQISKAMDLLFLNWLLGKAAKVAYLTEHERAFLAHSYSFGPEKLIHLPNAIPALATPTDVKRTEQVAFVARLHFRKRPADFIKLAGVMSGARIKFIMAGPDQGEKEICQAFIDSEKIENIQIMDALTRADTLELISKSRIYVLPSEQEPFPITVLEAIALGTPVLVTKQCGLAEAIELSGAGVTVDVGDIESMAKGVAEILQNWDSYNSRALALAQDFSRVSYNKRLVAFYETSSDGS